MSSIYGICSYTKFQLASWRSVSVLHSGSWHCHTPEKRGNTLGKLPDCFAALLFYYIFALRSCRRTYLGQVLPSAIKNSDKKKGNWYMPRRPSQ